MPVIACGLGVAADVTVQGGLTAATVPVVVIAGDGDLRGVWGRQTRKLRDREPSEGAEDL